MALEEDLPPEPRLMESMRSVGYTLEAALADLIDNSISADATQVDIEYSTHPYDFVCISDNGRGMTGAEARTAMRLAGASPLEERREDDLGRFGLGLKTASLSQCRDICLLTIGPEGLVGLEWDLDHLATTKKWSVRVLSPEDIETLPGAPALLAKGRGTAVLWRRLDAMRAQAGDDAGMDLAMVNARSHLQLVFHRFLGGEHVRPLKIRMNGEELPAIDPFLQSHKATASGPEETFQVDGATVRVLPFTLPHLNKMSARDRERAMIAGALRDSQGFYVYRAKRLVIWGTWFRLRPREDLAKLSRVRVDIPNSLDHLWALDIKKSAAQPPPQVKQRLRRFGEKMVERSRTTFTYRGRKADDRVVRAWTLVENGAEFRYEVNRDHPLVSGLADELNPGHLRRFGQILALLEMNYPADDLYSRLGGDARRSGTQSSRDQYVALADSLWQAFRLSNPDPERFIELMSRIEPFADLPEGAAVLKEAVE